MTVSSSVTDNFVVYKFIFEKIELDCGGMEVNQFNFLVALVAIVLIIIDLCLQKYIGQKGYIFLEINKYKLKFILVAVSLVLLIYSIVNKKYLLFICWLSLLKIIDKLIYIYRNNKF